MKFLNRKYSEFFVLAIGISLIFGITACKSFQGETPAQIAAKVCPAANATLASLNSLIGLPESTTKVLGELTPVVKATCTASEGITSNDINSLAVTIFPALTSIVLSSPLTDVQKNTAIADIGAAQAILDLYVATQPAPSTDIPEPPISKRITE